MEQQASVILFLGLILVGLLFLVLYLRSQILSTRQQLVSLTSLVDKLEARTQDLQTQILSLVKAPKKAPPKAKEPSSKSKQPVVSEPAKNPSKSKSLDLVGGVAQSRNAEIVTRTTRQDGKSLDTWISERNWSGADLMNLLLAHGKGLTSVEIAVKLDADLKDVVYGIARHVFNCEGDLEDLAAAPNHGKKWLTRDDETMKQLLEQGVGVSDVAFRLGRTPLAIIWRLTI